MILFDLQQQQMLIADDVKHLTELNHQTAETLAFKIMLTLIKMHLFSYIWLLLILFILMETIGGKLTHTLHINDTIYVVSFI